MTKLKVCAAGPTRMILLQGCAIDLPDVEPWPEPVDGAEVLDAM